MSKSENAKRSKAVRYLTSYSTTFTKFKKMMERAEELDSVLFATTQRYEEYQGGTSSKKDIAQIIVNLEEVHERARLYVLSLGADLDELVEVIEEVKVRDYRAGSVISARYITTGKLPTLEDIAEELHYSLDAVKRYHLRGLDIVAEIMEERGENIHQNTLSKVI